MKLTKYFRILWKKYLVGSSPPTPFFNNLGTPTLFHHFYGSHSSPDISFTPSSLALSCSWMCYKTWVIITSQSLLPFFFLHSLAPMNFLLLISGKFFEMTLLFTSIHTVLLQRYTSLFLFPLLLYSSPLSHSMRLNFSFFSAASNANHHLGSLPK